MTVAGTYSDGYTNDLSSTATWSITGISGVVTLTATATPTGTSVETVTCDTSLGTSGGSTTIQAASGGQTTTAQAIRAAPTLSSIAISPSSISLAAGASTPTPVTASGTNSDGSVTDVTGTVTWTIVDQTVASLNPANPSPGQPINVSCVANVSGGMTYIQASVTLPATANSPAVTITGATQVICQAPTLKSLAITPNPVPEINYGSTQQLTLTGTYSDSATQNLTSTAAWTSSASGARYPVTVSKGGLVTCPSNKPKQDVLSTIKASVGGQSASVAVTCEQFGGNGDGD